MIAFDLIWDSYVGYFVFTIISEVLGNKTLVTLLFSRTEKKKSQTQINKKPYMQPILHETIFQC